MATTFNILTDAPTIVYPNGGEIYTEDSITIQWIEPLNVLSGETVWYEIFITDSFDLLGKPELIQIATIPYGHSSYDYHINKNLKGVKSRIGIRAVNQRGQRSRISFSASDFIITNEELPYPSVLDPVDNGVYFSYIPIVFQHDGVLGRCSQRSFYQIFYMSKSQDIDWTLLKGNIMVGSDPFDLDVRNIPTSSDYALKIELVDDGHVSPPLFINDITVNNISYFVIDTVAPNGSIKILDNNEYSKNKDFIVRLEAYDKSSGVKEFQIEETDINTDTDAGGEFFSLTPTASWDIRTDNDGVKLIKVRYKDYGDNVILDSIDSMYFRTYKGLDNREVTAFLNDGIDIYIAFESNASNPSLEYPALYKRQSLLYTLEGNATALERYNGVLYIAIRDADENKGILQRESGSSVQSVVDNSNQYHDVEETVPNSLYLSDSIINTMEVFDDKLFLGLQNGELLSFNGGTMTSEDSSYLNLRNINLIKSDGSLLYVFFENSTEIMIMYKNSSGVYGKAIVDMGN